MKKNSFHSLVIIFMFLFGACNKTKDQAYVTTYSQPCLINGTDMIDVIFVTKQIPYHHLVFVYFRNASSRAINNAKIFIEICGSSPQNYDNCKNNWVINIGNLKVDDTTGYTLLNGPDLLFVNPGFAIDSNHVNVGIINYDTSNNYNDLSGIYEMNNEFQPIFVSTNSTLGLSANGYIFYDGKSTFRYKVIGNKPRFYNAFGIVANDTTYRGYLLDSSNNQVSLLTLGGSPKMIDTAGGTFKCTFNIDIPIFDSINAINMDLIK